MYDFSNGLTAKYLHQLYIKKYKLDSRFEIEVGSETYSPKNWIRSDKGFFKKRKDGGFSRHYAFLANYRVKSYGFPKMHLVNCRHVAEYTGFQTSNEQTVSIYCRESGVLHEGINLSICKDCRSAMYEVLTASWDISFSDFLLDLEESQNHKTVSVMSNGYTFNWPQISTAYRSTKNFTCERCNQKVKDEHKHLMQTHHKVAYEKTNNTRSNLECLCIDCHAKVDKYHIENFSKGPNRVLLEEFKRLYR